MVVPLSIELCCWASLSLQSSYCGNKTNRPIGLDPVETVTSPPPQMELIRPA
ncbi:hypothetical protein AWB81_07086 [Caballeronia arationis]|jgi:hypothetical protein|uniref:Uncharacterized protein n=1 Tax=Caballeronia arationis TaxID=1777142 RepID=A0A7Z7N0M7_9BURK|nr:hypothetical protein AWB81_07086 [Caballeronia arationis]SOE53353.1 hypothetical protein SAMN05446927_0638 [Caballeronia arationis]